MRFLSTALAWVPQNGCQASAGKSPTALSWHGSSPFPAPRRSPRCAFGRLDYSDEKEAARKEEILSNGVVDSGMSLREILVTVDLNGMIYDLCTIDDAAMFLPTSAKEQQGEPDGRKPIKPLKVLRMILHTSRTP